MVLNCQHVWRELSNYLDNEVDASVRRDMEAHLAQCRHCAALLDSTRNVVVLIADDRTFTLPAGFGKRLEERLAREFSSS